ncbi:hypothetical protein CPB86DRAFT_795962 [Serendipita vermifera]|nr:hypothetical protein CPB86DRAFT_795962 [Serendipita vermifera]
MAARHKQNLVTICGLYALSVLSGDVGGRQHNIPIRVTRFRNLGPIHDRYVPASPNDRTPRRQSERFIDTIVANTPIGVPESYMNSEVWRMKKRGYYGVSTVLLRRASFGNRLDRFRGFSYSTRRIYDKSQTSFRSLSDLLFLGRVQRFATLNLDLARANDCGHGYRRTVAVWTKKIWAKGIIPD